MSPATKSPATKPFQFVGVLAPRLADPTRGYLSIELADQRGEIGFNTTLTRLEVSYDRALRTLLDSDVLELELQLKINGESCGRSFVHNNRPGVPRKLFPAWALDGSWPNEGLKRIATVQHDTVIVEGPAGLLVKVGGHATLPEATS